MKEKQEMLDYYNNIFQNNSALPEFMKIIIKTVIDKIHEAEKGATFGLEIYSKDTEQFNQNDSIVDKQLKLLATIIEEIIPGYQVIIFLGTDNPEANMEIWFHEK